MKYLTLLLLFVALKAGAHEDHTKHQKSNLAISIAFDQAGILWRASVVDGFLQVDKSNDLGKTFATPLKVNLQAQKIGADGEARPKIAFGPEGNIYLTWTESLKTPFAGYIWFARSIDAGKTFEKPTIVHQDRAEITHRFDALNVAANGKITVSWVDKRDLVAAKHANKPYTGAAIYYAVSSNKGASFAPELKLADSSCECCRIATTNMPDGTGLNNTVVALWRHVFAGSERDHMIAEIPKQTEKVVAHRATFGHWVIDGCPHHGAAIASGGNAANWWGYHMAYFDGNDANKSNKAGPGLFYSRMDGEAWVASPPKKFGDNTKQSGHPAIVSIDDDVWLVWREINNGKTSILGMFSTDGGKSWNETKTIAITPQNADYPSLIAHKNQVYLSWNTLQDGLQVIALKPSSP